MLSLLLILLLLLLYCNCSCHSRSSSNYCYLFLEKKKMENSFLSKLGKRYPRRGKKQKIHFYQKEVKKCNTKLY